MDWRYKDEIAYILAYLPSGVLNSMWVWPELLIENVEMIYNNAEGNLDRGQPIFGAINGEFDLNSTPISMNVGASNDHYKTKELVFMSNFNKKFTENFGFNAQFMKQTWDVVGKNYE